MVNPSFLISYSYMTIFSPNNGQVILDCPHVLFSSTLSSTLMTIWAWHYRVECFVKAAKLRTSFVLASLTQNDRVKWKDKTRADGKLNRKWPYRLTTVNTEIQKVREEKQVGKFGWTCQYGWSTWDTEERKYLNHDSRDGALIDKTNSYKTLSHWLALFHMTSCQMVLDKLWGTFLDFGETVVCHHCILQKGSCLHIQS